MKLTQKTDIHTVIRRAAGIFISLHTLFAALVTITVITGYKTGEIPKVQKAVLVLGERIQRSLELSMNEPTPTPATSSARWRIELDNTPTPTVVARRTIIVQPKIIITTKPQTTTHIDTDAWFKKAQEENAAKAAQSAQQLQQFQLKSQQDMQNFSQQAQQGMTDFQAKSDANVKAFQEKYGF